MISAPQPSVVHLFTIFRQIGAGELRIPAFQREFVWKDRQIIDLLASVRDQYPIGSILLWYVDSKMLEIASHQVSAFPIVPEKYPTSYVLDGMQRLSTLYGAFHYAKGQDELFNIHYDLRSKCFIMERDINIFQNESTVPLASLMSPRKILEHQARISRLNDGDQLLDELLNTLAAFQDYMLPIVRIQETDVDRIVEIFERTNSTGTRLDTVDFMRAITWNQSFDLNRYLDIIDDELINTGFDLSNETIIKCVGLLLGVSPSAEGLLSLRNRGPHELRTAFMDFPKRFEAVRRFLRERLCIESLSYVPYEGQLLVLFKAIGMEEARSSEDFTRIEQWFWATGFNESLRGRPDHYVVRAVDNWRALVNGQIRGLEPRLRLSEMDFFERRLIKGKALSGAVAAMFAANKAKSLLSGNVIASKEYMSAPDLKSFKTIVSLEEFRSSGIDIGPSPRIFSNIIVSDFIDDLIYGQLDWKNKILELGRDRKIDILESQFIDEISYNALRNSDIIEFLGRRASLLYTKAQRLVGEI